METSHNIQGISLKQQNDAYIRLGLCLLQEGNILVSSDKYRI